MDCYCSFIPQFVANVGRKEGVGWEWEKVGRKEGVGWEWEKVGVNHLLKGN